MDRVAQDAGHELDVTLALLATPDSFAVPRAGGTALPLVSGRELVELVELDTLGLASIDRDGDWTTFGAMVRLRELADALPRPLSGLVEAEVDPDLLDRATVGGTIIAGGPTSPLLTGLLACEGVVTLMSRRVRHELPLAALLVGTAPPRDTLVLAVRVAVGGAVGVARHVRSNGAEVLAVARRTAGGRLLVAMSGVAPGPLLVRDPAELRRSVEPTPEDRLVEMVHRSSIEAIGRPEVLVPSISDHRTDEPVVDDTVAPITSRTPRRPLETVEADAAPSATAWGEAEVVVVRRPGVPPFAAVGTERAPRRIPAVHLPSDPIHVTVVESVSGERVGPVRAFDEVIGAVMLVEAGPDSDAVVGLMASSEAAVLGAAAALVEPQPPNRDTAAVMRTVAVVGREPDDESDAQTDSVVTDTLLRVDGTPDGDEPARVVGELDDEGRIVIRAMVADPFAVRRSVATALGVGAATIRVITRPGPSVPHESRLIEFVARTVRESGRAVVGTASPSPHRSVALAASSGRGTDGSVHWMRVTAIGGDSPAAGTGSEPVAWAGEMHLAAVARTEGLAREVLTVDGLALEPSLADGIARAKELIGFERRRDLRWTTPADRPGVSRGMGLAVVPGVTSAIGSVSATVSWAGGASFLVAVTTGDTLDGAHVALAQVAAEVLGVDPQQVTVVGGDTDRTPQGDAVSGLGLSVSAAAVKHAADDLRRRITRRASTRLGVEGRLVELVDGVAIGPDGVGVTIDELGSGSAVERAEPLVGAGFGRTGPSPSGAGAAVLAVEVELSTGAVSVLEVVVVTSAGVIVDPVGAGAQQRRDVRWACGAALGRAAFPEPLITSVFVEELDDEAPFGARSLGSVARRAVVPAIHAAVGDATGVDLGVVPFTAARVRAALHAER